METLILTIDTKAHAKQIAEALNLFKGVKEVQNISDLKVKASKKASIMDEIEQSLIEVKQMQEGKLPKKELKHLLNEK